MKPEKNETMRIVDYIMQFLSEKGSKSIFLLTGNGAMYINDAIAKCEGMTYYCARHEAAAPMMAESYARLTGKLGVVCVTSGPGSTNAISGLAEAWADSGPILILSGQSPTDQMPKNYLSKKVRSFGTAGFDIVPVVKPMTKYAVTVIDPTTIRYHLEKAYYLAMTGRPGPVWIDLPMDVQFAIINPNKLHGFVPEITEKFIDKEISDTLTLLCKSKKPLIIGGQGLRQAGALDLFYKIIDQMQIPIAFSRLGNDILPYSHHLNMGQVGRRGQRYSKDLLNEADFILVLGCRLSNSLAGKNLEHFSSSANIVMVDIDPAELEFHKDRLNIQICCDVKQFIENFILAYADFQPVDWKHWTLKCSERKLANKIIPENEVTKFKDPIDLYYFMSRLDNASGEENIMITDAGSNYYVGGQIFHFEKKQREITSGAFAAMGLSIPLAIGAAVAKPNFQILAVTGDGSLELNIQELKTISYYKFNIKLFVINNGGYVSMRNWQDNFFGGRRIGSDDNTGAEMLNLESVAKAFELEYTRISNTKKIDENLKSIMNKKNPVFVEVICDSNQKIIQPYLENELSS